MSERDEGWTLRRVAVLQSLALALARGGNHAAAEDRLLAAIGELRELDDSGAAHKVMSPVYMSCMPTCVDEGSFPQAFCVRASRPNPSYLHIIFSSLCLPSRGALCFAHGRTFALFQETLIELYKYLGIARRARGDMPGATEAMKSIAALGGGSSGQDDVEDLNRMLGHNRISVD